MSGTNGRSRDSARGKVAAKRLLCGSSLSALMLLTLPTAAQAQDANRNWDANGTAVGNGNSGTPAQNVWDTTTLRWSPNTDGVSGPYGPWDNTLLDNAIFGGTAGTVTLGTPITVHNITFNTANYTLTGNTLTLAGTTPTITVNSGTSTINSIIAGTAGLTKAGAGAMTLSGNNSFTGGVTVDAGTLTLSGTNGFAGNVNVNAGTPELERDEQLHRDDQRQRWRAGCRLKRVVGKFRQCHQCRRRGDFALDRVADRPRRQPHERTSDTVFGRGRCPFYRNRWDQPYFLRQLRRRYRAQRHHQRLYWSGAAHCQ